MTGEHWAVVLVFFAVYFLPTVVALTKDRPNKGAIFGLNLLLGWTAIGWIVAFIWSLTSGRHVLPPVVIAERQSAPPPQRHEATKRCPACAELVLMEAKKCKHCGEIFESPKAPEQQSPRGLAYCPGCGKLRGYSVAKCVYCGDTSPVGETQLAP